MPGEINKPGAPTYWFAYSQDGTKHTGVTEPDQVTTTGQETIVYDANAPKFAAKADATGVAAFESLPDVGEEVLRNQIYTHEGKTYVCVQSHRRTIDDPSDVPALFSTARTDGDPWVQPLGGHDAYPIDSVVAHDSKRWRSLVEANVWEPGAAGSELLWEDITAGPPSVDPWVQPQGAHDAYQIDDEVTHKGSHWVSTVANNVWEPGVFGWDVVE
jgi:hypothetical protein